MFGRKKKLQEEQLAQGKAVFESCAGTVAVTFEATSKSFLVSMSQLARPQQVHNAALIDWIHRGMA